MLLFCPKCGISNEAGSTFCRGCGNKLPSAPSAVSCPFCGAEGQESRQTCSKCGKDLPIEESISFTSSVSVSSAMNPCPQCGASNRPGVPFCGKCGKRLSTDDVSASAVRVPGVQSSSAFRFCPWCGKELRIGEPTCWYCGKPVDQKQTVYPSRVRGSYEDSSFEYGTETTAVTVAGIVLVVLGVVAFGEGIILLMAESIAQRIYGFATGFLTCCGSLELLFGVAAIAGGVFAIQRKHFALVLVGAILAMLSIGPFYISFIVGLICVIFIAMNKDEFYD